MASIEECMRTIILKYPALVVVLIRQLKFILICIH